MSWPRNTANPSFLQYQSEIHNNKFNCCLEIQLKTAARISVCTLISLIANIMKNYLTNIITHLNIKPTKLDPSANLESIIDIFQNHENAQRIKLANFFSKSNLKFNSVTEERNLNFFVRLILGKRGSTELPAHDGKLTSDMNLI